MQQETLWLIFVKHFYRELHFFINFILLKMSKPLVQTYFTIIIFLPLCLLQMKPLCLLQIKEEKMP